MDSVNQVAYFFVSSGSHAWYRAVLIPNHDVMPLATLTNAVQVYPTYAGVVEGYEDVKLICCIISPELQADLEDIAETDDWATLSTVVGIDIAGKYAGRDLSYTPKWGVFAEHPALDGQVQVGTDPESDEPVMSDIVNRVQWP